MNILCLTPIKHLDGIYDYLESFGEVYYNPDLNKDEFNFLHMGDYDVIFCNPNKQKYLLNEETLGEFNGTILTASTGLNHIDTDYCKSKDIKVLSLTEDMRLLEQLPSTAELAFGLMLSIMRNIPNSFEDVKVGGWDYDMFMGHQLKGKRIGVIGYGRLGKMMIRYCWGFGMYPAVYDPYKEYNNLDMVLKSADVISLHVNATDETRHMVDKKFLDRL